MKRLTVDPEPTPITAPRRHVGERRLGDLALELVLRHFVPWNRRVADHLLGNDPGVELLGR